MNGHRLRDGAVPGPLSDDMAILRLLAAAQRLLMGANPLGALPQIARLVVPDYADLCAIYVMDGEDLLRLATVHTTACMAGAPSVLERVLLAQSTGVMRTRERLLVPDLGMADDVLADTARAGAIVLASALYVPLYVQAQPVGVLCMLLGTSGARYDGRALAAAEHLAAYLALALDHARLRDLHPAPPRPSAEHVGLLAFPQTLDAPAVLCGPAPDYRCRWHTPAFVRLVRPAWPEHESVVGQPLHELVDVAGHAVIQRHMIATDQVRGIAWSVWPLHDGTGMAAGLLLIGDQRAVGLYGTADHQIHQQQRLMAQKLESLGLFASGIAHDLNNILTVVQGNIELALMDLDLADDPMGEKYLTTVETASHRATDLVRQILAYTSTRADDSQPVQLNRLIQEMNDLLHASISRQITLTYDLAPDLPLITVNVTQMRQVVLNLMLNAVDAIGLNRGAITVRTGIQAIPHDGPPTGTGEAVFVEIHDSGCGIAAAQLATIFEPFFTTKPAGCGLGLAAVQGIMQAHHGQIEVTSEPGHGTTFRIRLPSTCPSMATTAPAAIAAAWQGGGTVVVIDDDSAVRHTIGRMLEKLGFTVLEAAGGLEGLRLLMRQEQRIDAVLVDVTMPGLNGYEILSLIHTSLPAIPVVLMSAGFTPDQQAQGADGPSVVRFLRKPLSFGALRRLFEELDHPG